MHEVDRSGRKTGVATRGPFPGTTLPPEPSAGEGLPRLADKLDPEEQNTGTRLPRLGATPPEGPGHGPTGDGVTAPPALVLSDIVVRFGARRVLDHIQITIHEGEFVGVIGPNGAGKSTLLKVVLGLVRPESGEVRLPALPSANRRPGHLIGYVPQRFDPDPDLPIRARDLVGLGLDGHRFGFPLPSRDRAARVTEALRRVDALGYEDAPVGRLSGGELERLLIAQALVSQPRLLLLDEPLASLDIRSANAIIRMLERIARQDKMTVLLVTHDMNPLLPVMDRLLYLANGHAAIGRVEDVVREDVLRKLYGYDVEVLRVRDRILVVGDETADEEIAASHHL